MLNRLAVVGRVPHTLTTVILPREGLNRCEGCLPVVQVIAVKAPGFGERKTSYLEDIAILTGAQVVKDELGLTLDKVSPLLLLMLP